MDITVKKYEHRHLAMSVCEHRCNVGEKYVLPQAQAFGLSWSMDTAGLADIHNNSARAIGLSWNLQAFNSKQKTR